MYLDRRKLESELGILKTLKTNTTLALPTYNGLWRCLGFRNSGVAACYRKNFYECIDGSMQ